MITASCTQWYYAEDGNGDQLPFTMRFEFYEWEDGGWVGAGLYGVGPGSFLQMALDSTQTYKVVPLDEVIIDGSLQTLEGWKIPLASAFFGCATDITFVYEKMCDPPRTGDVHASDGTPNIGDTISFWRDGEYGGDGQYVVARLWEFGDGGTATTPSATHAYTTAGTYVVKFTVTNDCGKSDYSTLNITVQPETAGNGFTIKVSNALATKNVLVAHVVKMPFIGLIGPDPNLWYWPQLFDYVGGKWYTADPATTYRAEVGSIFEAIPSFNKTYGTGSFAEGIHCVVLAEGTSGVNTLIFKGEDVFQLFSGSPTEIYLSSTSNDVISEAFMGPVCDLFSIPRGSECNAFWAEFYDPVFVANYVSISETGKDTLGNERELTAFDKIALPFAILGCLPGLSFLPFGAMVTKGLGIAKKFGDEAVQFMLNFSMDAANKVSSKDTWYFLDAIGQVTEAHANEIVDALTAGDTNLANTLLRRYAGESKGWWDYHKLNDMLKDALPTDAYNWLRTQIGLTEIGGAITTKIAKQSTLSADDIAKLASAAEDSEVLTRAAEIVSKTARRVVELAESGNSEAAWDAALGLKMVCKNEPEIIKVMTPSQLEDLRKGLLEAFDAAEVKRIIDDALGLAGRLITEYYPKLIKFIDGTGDITKADIEDILSLGRDDPDDVIDLLFRFTATDKQKLITKLRDGTHRQPVGNMFDVTTKYASFMSDTQLTDVVAKNCRIGLKALDSTDPAKMADIPHAAQEYAASYADVATDMGGNIADDIVKATDDLVTQPTSNWKTTAKQTVKNTSNKFWNYFNGLSDAAQERVVHGMVAGTLVFAAVVLYKIYTNAGPQTLNHGLFTSKMDSLYWPCYHACEDGRADDLDAAIKLYQSTINDCAESLYDCKTALEADGTYEEFSRTLQIHQFNLSRMKSCLENLQPCGSIHCTSNEDFFYVDLDGQPAGFSYANREILLTAVKTGFHNVKIHKHGYTPECTESVNVSEGDIEKVDCQMFGTGSCSAVTDVKIYVDPLSPIEDQTVSFNGAANSDDPIASWEWKFGDGFTATGQAVTHPYSSAGIYTVVLIVTNDCGQSQSTTRNITVTEEEPPTESTTLRIETPIGTDGNEISRYWEIEIWVDGKDTACNPPKTLTFGTNVFCDCTSPWNLVPCELGTHTITLKKYGYTDKSISVYMEKDTPKTWHSPVMVVSTAPPTQHTISFSVPIGSIAYVDGKQLT